MKKGLTKCLYLSKTSRPHVSRNPLLKAPIHKGTPYQNLIVIKEILTINVCEASIHKGIPNQRSLFMKDSPTRSIYSKKEFLTLILCEDCICKGLPYQKPLFIKRVPHQKLLFIKEILIISLYGCEDVIYKCIPFYKEATRDVVKTLLQRQ